MARSCVVSAAALTGLAGAALGQITPIGPFSGPFSEGFDLQVASGFPQCVADRVFNNTANLCTFSAPGVPTGGAHITGGWGFNCSIGANLTPRIFGASSGYAEYEFDAPISNFGGYFGTNGNNNVASGATVTFYDENGAEIGNAPITFQACGEWRWSGWTSTVPIKRISVFGNGYNGSYVMMDDMEYERGAITLGACCLPDGSCLLNTANGCAAQGGIYRGDNTPCATANCPQPPTGACCFFDGTCAVLTEAQCLTQSGVYRGDNSACATVNCPVTGCTETTDAGDLPQTAYSCPGSGPLTRIQGTLGSITDADMYEINICSPGSFSATTVGVTQIDTQLFLFRADGTGVTFNDDSTGVQSTLTSQFVASLPAGTYYLAVSTYDLDPVDAGNLEIWLDTPYGQERQPDGPGAANPIRGWTEDGDTGPYTILLQGTCFAGPAPCYPNCDGSTVPPILNVSDFICFQTKFAQNDPYANCDGSTIPPVLNVADFICFQTSYAAGCS